jgi:hypothetical protein
MAGPGDPASLAPAVLLGALAAWILVPLALAVAVFHRRSV